MQPGLIYVCNGQSSASSGMFSVAGEAPERDTLKTLVRDTQLLRGELGWYPEPIPRALLELHLMFPCVD